MQPSPIPFAEKLLRVVRTFREQGVPFAFGDAIARNYYAEPRLTLDLDLSIFLPPESHTQVLRALETLFPIADPEEVSQLIRRDAQARVFWDTTALDLFFSYDPFHTVTAARVREAPYAGSTIPIHSPEDVILHKLLFNRAKDWRDIADMLYTQQDALDLASIRNWLHYFFPPDETLAEGEEGRQDLRVTRFGDLVGAIRRIWEEEQRG